MEGGMVDHSPLPLVHFLEVDALLDEHLHHAALAMNGCEVAASVTFERGREETQAGWSQLVMSDSVLAVKCMEVGLALYLPLLSLAVKSTPASIKI